MKGVNATDMLLMLLRRQVLDSGRSGGIGVRPRGVCVDGAHRIRTTTWQWKDISRMGLEGR